jgi:hypothetical protein
MSNSDGGSLHDCAESDTADADEAEAREEAQAREHAWAVHQSVQSSTGRIETRTSFLLTLEAAVFVFFGTQLLGSVDEQGNQTSFVQAMAAVFAYYEWVGGLVGAGIVIIFLGMILLLKCLTLPIREDGRITAGSNNGIYFGHLERSKEADIVRLFREDRVNQLARDIKRSSSVARQKQQYLNLSAGLAAVGLFLITVAYVIGLFLLALNTP